MSHELSRRDWLTRLGACASVGVGGQLLSASLTSADAETPAFRHAAPSEPAGIVRLDRNESPYPPSPSAVAAMSASLGGSNRYAHDARDVLTAKLAKLNGLPVENVLVGDGSTEAMGLLAGTLFRDGGQIVSAARTFGVLQRNVERLGGTWVKAKMRPDMQVDMSAIASAITQSTRAVYLCNPNNPTGTLVPAHTFREAVLEMSKRTLVVIDEAYADYLSPSDRAELVSLVGAGENVCILRTFSKIHGLAGMRVGCAMGRKELLVRLRRAEWGTQMTNLAGLVGAAASLDDTAHISEIRKRNAEVMAHTQAMLKTKGYAPIPSTANHIWFAVRGPAARFRERMASAGYAVVASSEADGEWCRLTLGTMDQMRGFEKVLSPAAGS